MTSDTNNCHQPSVLYGVRLDRERDRAQRNASARRAEAIGAYAAGHLLEAASLLLAAQVYEDSARYWAEELRIFEMGSTSAVAHVHLNTPGTLSSRLTQQQESHPWWDSAVG